MIDILQDYTSHIPEIFTLSLEDLRQKALHAPFSLTRHTDFSKLKPSLASTIFDTMISPILTYNSEVWGAFVKSDFISHQGLLDPESKKLIYTFVHNKSFNVACRSEFGRFPFIIDINKRILNYLNYLQENDENSVDRRSLKISVDLHHNGQNSF